MHCILPLGQKALIVYSILFHRINGGRLMSQSLRHSKQSGGGKMEIGPTQKGKLGKFHVFGELIKRGYNLCGQDRR